MNPKLPTMVLENATIKSNPSSLDWLISFKDPRALWEDNWFAVALEVGCALLFLQAYYHGKRQGRSSMFVPLAAASTAFCFELFPFIPMPGYLLWWYHQGIVTFSQQRAPSYVISLYAVVHYIAHCSTSHTNLPPVARSLLTSLAAMFVYTPLLWLGPRLLLLLLHFDDPMFNDKLFGVPYIQLVTMVLMFFHTSHVFQQKYDGLEEKDRHLFNELRCALLAGLSAAAFSIVEQYLLYISLNLTFKAHTAVCLLAALAIIAYLAKDEIREYQFKGYSRTGILSPLTRKVWWAFVCAFAAICCIPLLIQPEHLRSNSARMELGPCNVFQEVCNTSPLEIRRRRYICPNDTDRLGFDFHCVPEHELWHSVSKVTKHYTICGSPFVNPVLMTTQLVIYSAACLVAVYTILSLSFEFKIQSKESVEIRKKLE